MLTDVNLASKGIPEGCGLTVINPYQMLRNVRFIDSDKLTARGNKSKRNDGRNMTNDDK